MELRLSCDEEYKKVFELITQRIDWMNEKGLHLWNETDYLNVYPIDYYRDSQDAHELYVLAEGTEIFGAVVLLESDERWQDHHDAYYLHNLVTKINSHLSGLFFDLIVDKAIQSHKCYLRLDSAANSAFLTDFYTQLGFVAKGECHEGKYSGILRELLIKDYKKTS